MLSSIKDLDSIIYFDTYFINQVSGFLMDVDTWADKLAKKHKNLKVLQIHGKTTPKLYSKKVI
jgi:hypothetical protein